LWQASEGVLNPGDLNGSWSLCNAYGLLVTDERGILRVTPLGRNFLENPSGEAVQYLDYSEGVSQLLVTVAEHGPAKRAELIPYFAEFLSDYSKIKSPTSVGARWQDRVANLVERGLVSRDETLYRITPAGMVYLEESALRLAQHTDSTTARAVIDLRRLLVEQHTQVRQKLGEVLRTIDPYRLEGVVKTLLGAMGYEKVEVTRRSGDGGVDVVGEIRVGITYVREVVQVKRQQGNVQRPVLDQLRGSLHRFKAFRGTIITTGRFSKGAQESAFEVGAAPITLIDGERLTDLLIEHEIGARKAQVEVINFSPADFQVENVDES
jgi:restriction system protein